MSGVNCFGCRTALEVRNNGVNIDAVPLEMAHIQAYVTASIKRGRKLRQPALTGQRWFKDAAIGNNTVVSETSRDARGFLFSPTDPD